MNESGTWAEYQKLVLRLLEQHDQRLEELQRDLTTATQDRAVLASHISSMKEDVSILLEIIRDGSGLNQSVLNRIGSLEYRLQNIESTEEKRSKDSEAMKTTRRNVLIAIGTSILGFVWQIVKGFIDK